MQFLLLSIFIISKIVCQNILDFVSEARWPDTCRGRRQTPIDFPAPNSANSPYKPLNDTRILFNTYKPVSGISMLVDLGAGKFGFTTNQDMGDLYFVKNGLFYKYNLKEFHFHALAEHTFNGTQHDLEMHLVHFKDKPFFFSANPNVTVDPDAQQEALVTGIIFRRNDDKNNLNSNANNTFLQALKFWDETVRIDNITLNDFVRPDKAFLHYEGSLTTPGCNEFINWVVFTQIERISSAQITDFMNLIRRRGFPSGNTRKVQPLNGRTIFYNDNKTYGPVVLRSNTVYLTLSSLVFLFLVYLI